MLIAEVSFFGHLRDKAGVKTEAYEFSQGETVGDALEVVSKERGIENEVFDDDPIPGAKTKSSVNILLNGRNIKFLQGFDTPLGDGDRVSIFPPTGGG